MPHDLAPAFPAQPLGQDLAAEAHHRIANSLALVSGLVLMQSAAIQPDARLNGHEVRMMLDGVGGRLAAVGRLHRLLAQKAGGQCVDVGEYLREVSKTVFAALSSPDRTELVYEAQDDCILATPVALPLGLIAGEMLTNALKYAHPAHVRGQVSLHCAKADDGALVLKIADDGIGLPEGFDPMSSDSLGFRLVRQLAHQVGANIAFASDSLGLTFTLRVPAAAQVL